MITISLTISRMLMRIAPFVPPLLNQGHVENVIQKVGNKNPTTIWFLFSLSFSLPYFGACQRTLQLMWVVSSLPRIFYAARSL